MTVRVSLILPENCSGPPSVSSLQETDDPAESYRRGIDFFQACSGQVQLIEKMEILPCRPTASEIETSMIRACAARVPERLAQGPARAMQAD